ncbi:MAG: hypothetical protein ABSG53_32000 [Thermoguttaceae bacterium]|jgi:AmiR/NasT family two-component response regulator
MPLESASTNSAFRVESSSARLVVCERSGSWSVALRGELAEAGVRVWEYRTLPEAWEALAQTPAAFVIAEATRENLDNLLQRMIWMSRDFPQARIAVVGQRNMARFEWLLREAGAVHFLTSPRRLAPLAGLVVRHLANAPLPPQTMLERIWGSLPWGPRET